MVSFLQQHNSDASSAATTPRPPRTARVQVVLSEGDSPGQLHELIVDLDGGVVAKKTFLEGKHPYIDAEYMKAVEETCAQDESIKEEIAKLDLPPEAEVCIEAWAYATDGMNDTRERTSMVRKRA
jgi:primary-amine oxidase